MTICMKNHVFISNALLFVIAIKPKATDNRVAATFFNVIYKTLIRAAYLSKIYYHTFQGCISCAYTAPIL
jgi:hypothetical protein